MHRRPSTRTSSRWTKGTSRSRTWRGTTSCTQCGACGLRCPNTLFTGDFYRFRTRTVDLVKAMRALAVDHGVHQPGWQRWNQLTDERKNGRC